MFWIYTKRRQESSGWPWEITASQVSVALCFTWPASPDVTSGLVLHRQDRNHLWVLFSHQIVCPYNNSCFATTFSYYSECSISLYSRVPTADTHCQSQISFLDSRPLLKGWYPNHTQLVNIFKHISIKLIFKAQHSLGRHIPTQSLSIFLPIFLYNMRKKLLSTAFPHIST